MDFLIKEEVYYEKNPMPALFASADGNVLMLGAYFCVCGGRQNPPSAPR